MESTTVLLRLSQGESLLLDSSYSYQGRFKNGDTVPHQIMSHLVDQGVFAERPMRGEAWVMQMVVAF